MDTPLSEKTLSAAQRAFERDEARAARSRTKRDALIADAIAAGWSQTRIATATGLTRGRVGQLASRLKGLTP
jgi:DNA-binding NarL/FixJ family response regulator